MNHVTVIATIALIAIVFLAVRYIVREKKKGNKCVGCPYAGECCKYSSEEMDDLVAEIKAGLNTGTTVNRSTGCTACENKSA